MEGVPNPADENLFACARLSFLPSPVLRPSGNRFASERQFEFERHPSKVERRPRLLPLGVVGASTSSCTTLRRIVRIPPTPPPRPDSPVYPPRHVFTDSELLTLQLARLGQELFVQEICELFPNIDDEKVYREMCLTSPPRRDDYYGEDGNLKPRKEMLSVLSAYRRLDSDWDPVTNQDPPIPFVKVDDDDAKDSSDEAYEPHEETPRIVARPKRGKKLAKAANARARADAALGLLRLASGSSAMGSSSSLGDDDDDDDEFTSSAEWRAREIVGAAVADVNIVTSKRRRRLTRDRFNYDDRMEKERLYRLKKERLYRIQKEDHKKKRHAQPKGAVQCRRKSEKSRRKGDNEGLASRAPTDVPSAVD